MLNSNIYRFLRYSFFLLSSLTPCAERFFTESEPTHVRDFAQNRVGVDAYGWLHRGIYTCASRICRGADTGMYVDYCMHRVRMLIHFGIIPVLVFDGAALPMKATTHAERREKREEALRKAEEALAKGNSRLAEDFYQRACAVTPEMARKLIRECRRINVEYVVSPYEADAQLAWMMRTGHVDGVITEDSDLLVYGASKVFYKMTKAGEGDLYRMANLPSLHAVSMHNFTEEMFMYMCVCAGCDFFKGVQGLGLRKAHALVKRFRTMARLIHAIRHDRRYAVSGSFTFDFARACLVFRHQTVYDIRTSKTVALRELDAVAKARLPTGVLEQREDGTLDLSFLGEHRDSHIAKGIAEGFIHPSSLKDYDEPLDLIERPVRAGVRPKSLQKYSNLPPLTSKKVVQDIRGFQVQPAKSASCNPLARTPNLRQRLTERPRTFNPRRIAAGFKANNLISSTATPKFLAPPSSIWARFQANQPSKDININDDAADTDEGNTQLANDGTISESEGDEPSPNQCCKRPRGSRIEPPEAKRPKAGAAASNRVKAVNRAVSRFAIDDTHYDEKFKFAASPKAPPSESKIAQELKATHILQNGEGPPSPDREAYELFEKVDAELSRDAEAAKPVLIGSVKRSAKESGASSGKQALLSRFFSHEMTNSSGPAKQIAKTSPRVTPKLQKKSPKQMNTTLRAKLSSASRSKAVERFKRGANGKRVTARKLHAINETK